MNAPIGLLFNMALGSVRPDLRSEAKHASLGRGPPARAHSLRDQTASVRMQNILARSLWNSRVPNRRDAILGSDGRQGAQFLNGHSPEGRPPEFSFLLRTVF